tara:strand:+ start:532 stop:1194 length:663 start_codon:yes stop_codon:yes gene_type:complete
MNSQLKSFLNLLNKNKVQYWIDSGTLLGLVRDGDVLINDKDIDIGIHESQIDKISQLESKFIKHKYKYRYEFYNGEICKYKLYPQNKNNFLTIDINVYREKNKDFLWCPLTFFIKPENFIFKHVQKIIKFFWRRVFKTVETNKFPYNKIKKNYTWVIPYKYYKNIIFNQDLFCYMFKEKEEYLNYRYKNWKLKVENWDTFKDDGGVILKAPQKFISEKII